MGKAFDDRLGVCTVLDLIRSLKEGKIKHPNKVVAACTVQEEVGTRGAKTVANSVKPDVAIIVDVDIAGDVPGIDPIMAPAHMGEGLAITIWDGGMIPNQPLKELVLLGVREKEDPVPDVIREGREHGRHGDPCGQYRCPDHRHRDPGKAHPFPRGGVRSPGPGELGQTVPGARQRRWTGKQ